MSKLNNLLRIWPNGTVGTQFWLEQQAIYPQLSKKYVTNGWLTKIGHGAFIKAGDQVDLFGGLYALQQELKLPVHLGGKSALDFLGSSHFVPKHNNITYIYNYGVGAERYLPAWFNQFFAKHSIHYVRTKLFNTELGLIEHHTNTFCVKLASVERALFELLALVPEEVITYQHAYLIMQNQVFLRVDLVQELLESCSSQLLKRLFLHLTKKCGLPVLERLRFNNIELGQGRRTIGNKAAVYDPEFKLAVPPLENDGTENMEL